MSADRATLRVLAEQASRGPWHWSGNTATRVLNLCTWIPGMGRVTVMDFTRWGMQGARPRFRDAQWMMRDADEMAEWEVCKQATDPNDRRLYRHDVTGIRHPDAAFIAAASPDVVLALLDEIDRLSGGSDA